LFSVGRRSDSGKNNDREAQAASAFNPPNICTIYHIGEVDGCASMVTEFLEGLTLKRMIAGRRLEPERLLDCPTVCRPGGQRTKEEAFTWLTTADRERDWTLEGLRTDFMLDPLRSDPRLAEMVHKVGLPP
jgi:predicted Fe-S protein YdhL (DUF1289 family)